MRVVVKAASVVAATALSLFTVFAIAVPATTLDIPAASAAAPLNLVLTPDWQEVPKEVIHLNDGYSLRPFQVDNLPSTINCVGNNFVAKRNMIASGEKVVLSTAENPLRLRFPSVAEALTGEKVDIVLDIAVTLTGKSLGASYMYPYFLLVGSKVVSFTADCYNTNTGTFGHTPLPPVEDRNSYSATYDVTFHMYKTGTTEAIDGYFLSAVDDMDTSGESAELLGDIEDSTIWTSDADYLNYYTISADNRKWSGILTDKMTPSSLDHHLGFLMKWRDGTQVRFQQSFWTASQMISTFEPASITATAGEGGSISSPNKSSVWWKNDKTYNIVPAAGHRIKDVVVDGVSVGDVSSYTFKEVVSNHAIHAEFEKAPVSITWIDTLTNEEIASYGLLYGEPSPIPALPSHRGHRFAYLTGDDWSSVVADSTVYVHYSPYLYTAPHYSSANYNGFTFAYKTT